MDFLNNITDNSILIIPNNIKNKILDYINENKILKSIKILTFIEIKKSLCFDYNNETINYVMKRNNVNYNTAKKYIENLYYIIENSYTNSKLNNLLELKKELMNNNLLIYDNLFLSLIKSKSNIYVYGFDYISNYNKYLLNKMGNYIEIKKERKEYKHTVYELNSIADEIAFVAEQICELISNNIPIDKIYIANYSNEYYFTINRIFNNFNIPFYIKSETSLYDTSIGTYFINHLDNNLLNLLNKIKKIFKTEENFYNNLIYQKLFNLLNSYYWCNNILDCKEMLIEEMRNTKIPSLHQKNEIKTNQILNNNFLDDEYVFLIGFNNNIPKIKIDTDYINDSIKPDILETSYEYNKNIKEATINAIKNIKNITITYKKYSAFNTYEPSYLIENNYLKVEKINKSIYNYSNDYNKLIYAEKLDNLIKYNEYDKNLEILNKNYEINYNNYNNKYTKINKRLINSYIDNKINFSYSNIKEYYECPFKFYLNSIIHLGKYEDNLDQFIGHIFHYCLEECLKNDNTNYSEIYENYITENENKIENTNKNKFFLKMLKEEIKFVIETIKEQYAHMHITETYYEKEIEIKINKEIKTTLKAFVDKVLVSNNYCFIIDYKTNSLTIDPELFEYGIGIQLPIYLYLIKNLNSNYEVIGIYLQHILNKNVNYIKDKDLKEEKKKAFKLDGITFDNSKGLKELDDDYENSSIIKGLKIKEYNKRFKSLEDRNNLEKQIEKIINDCIDNVIDSNFEINPIFINDGKKANGCKYCSYKDICYKKSSDYKRIKIKGDDTND